MSYIFSGKSGHPNPMIHAPCMYACVIRKQFYNEGHQCGDYTYSQNMNRKLNVVLYNMYDSLTRRIGNAVCPDDRCNSQQPQRHL